MSPAVALLLFAVAGVSEFITPSARRGLKRALFWLAWALAVVWAGLLLAGCAPAKADPPPDVLGRTGTCTPERLYVVSDPGEQPARYACYVPTTTTLAEPGYVPSPAGPPTEAER